MTVYVVQESMKFNLLPAAEYGELQTLLPQGQVMLATAPTIRALRDKLRTFSDSDYLLAIGDPIAIGLSVAIATGFNGGKIKMLKWDRQEHRYYAIEADLNGVRQNA
jgi:hypothetical protein